MKRESLIKSKEYIVSQIQLGLLNLIGNYKDKKNLKDYQLAQELGVSKGYVSQILNATYDHKISKVVDLSLACNAVPLIFFVPLEDYLKADKEDKIYFPYLTTRPRNITYQSSIEASAEIKKSLVIKDNKHGEISKISVYPFQFSNV